MSDGDHKPAGLLDTARRVGDSLLGLVQNRVELFALELQEEKLRAVKLLIWLALALALGMAGLLLGLGALALFLWQLSGYIGLVGLAVVSLACAAAILWFVHSRVRKGPVPFNQTVAEFKKDRECLRKKD